MATLSAGTKRQSLNLKPAPSLSPSTTVNMSSSHITVGLIEDGRVSSRVTRPPGGVSTIFSDSDTASTSSSASSTTGEVSPTTKRPQKVYKMASNFELGDEQPSQQELEMKARRRSKPSVNPLTGELIGNFGYGVEAKDDEGDQSVPAAAQVTPVKSSRVPPGGYSTPLW